jgi:hypothetical protein
MRRSKSWLINRNIHRLKLANRKHSQSSSRIKTQKFPMLNGRAAPDICTELKADSIYVKSLPNSRLVIVKRHLPEVPMKQATRMPVDNLPDQTLLNHDAPISFRMHAGNISASIGACEFSPASPPFPQQMFSQANPLEIQQLTCYGQQGACVNSNYSSTEIKQSWCFPQWELAECGDIGYFHFQKSENQLFPSDDAKLMQKPPSLNSAHRIDVSNLVFSTQTNIVGAYSRDNLQSANEFGDNSHNSINLDADLSRFGRPSLYPHFKLESSLETSASCKLAGFKELMRCCVGSPNTCALGSPNTREGTRECQIEKEDSVAPSNASIQLFPNPTEKHLLKLRCDLIGHSCNKKEQSVLYSERQINDSTTVSDQDKHLNSISSAISGNDFIATQEHSNMPDRLRASQAELEDSMSAHPNSKKISVEMHQDPDDSMGPYNDGVSVNCRLQNALSLPPLLPQENSEAVHQGFFRNRKEVGLDHLTLHDAEQAFLQEVVSSSGLQMALAHGVSSNFVRNGPIYDGGECNHIELDFFPIEIFVSNPFESDAVQFSCLRELGQITPTGNVVSDNLKVDHGKDCSLAASTFQAQPEVFDISDKARVYEEETSSSGKYLHDDRPPAGRPGSAESSGQARSTHVEWNALHVETQTDTLSETPHGTLQSQQISMEISNFLNSENNMRSHDEDVLLLSSWSVEPVSSPKQRRDDCSVAPDPAYISSIKEAQLVCSMQTVDSGRGIDFCGDQGQKPEVPQRQNATIAYSLTSGFLPSFSATGTVSELLGSGVVEWAAEMSPSRCGDAKLQSLEIDSEEFGLEDGMKGENVFRIQNTASRNLYVKAPSCGVHVNNLEIDSRSRPALQPVSLNTLPIHIETVESLSSGLSLSIQSLQCSEHQTNSQQTADKHHDNLKGRSEIQVSEQFDKVDLCHRSINQIQVELDLSSLAPGADWRQRVKLLKQPHQAASMTRPGPKTRISEDIQLVLLTQSVDEARKSDSNFVHDSKNPSAASPSGEQHSESVIQIGKRVQRVRRAYERKEKENKSLQEQGTTIGRPRHLVELDLSFHPVRTVL